MTPDYEAELKEQMNLLAQTFPELYLALQEPANFTRKGRIKVTTLARSLNLKPSQVQASLQQCRELLDS